MMLALPWQVDATTYSVLIALGDESLERIRDHDPGVIEMLKVRQQTPWIERRGLQLRDIVITYASAEDFAEVKRLATRDVPARDVVKYLTRGYADRPDLGDGGAYGPLGDSHA